MKKLNPSQKQDDANHAFSYYGRRPLASRKGRGVTPLDLPYLKIIIRNSYGGKLVLIMPAEASGSGVAYDLAC